jgi:predicted metalloprotease with PDZ domain
MRVVEPSGALVGWVHEGLPTHVARKLLFASKRISAEELASDVQRIEEAGDDAYRRGSAYVAALDLAIARGSHGKRSIDDVTRALGAEGGDIPLARFRALVGRAIGDGGEARFDAIVTGPTELPAEAYGPCFERAMVTLPGVDFGFDSAALALDPAIVRNVKKGSAADKAGLRDGMLVLSSHLPPAGESGEVDLTVTGKGGSKRVRYRATEPRRALRFVARADCASK